MENTSIQTTPLLTKEAAAVFLQISTPSLDRWVKEGKITPIKIGRTVRFSRESLINLSNRTITLKTH